MSGSDAGPSTAGIRDTNNKHSALCALLKELPKENYDTLRTLMLHLNRVTARSSVNLMTSQNLGVVFGREWSFRSPSYRLLRADQSLSDIDAFVRPESRVWGYGRKGTLHPVDGGQCAASLRRGTMRLGLFGLQLAFHPHTSPSYPFGSIYPFCSSPRISSSLPLSRIVGACLVSYSSWHVIA